MLSNVEKGREMTLAVILNNIPWPLFSSQIIMWFYIVGIRILIHNFFCVLNGIK